VGDKPFFGSIITYTLIKADLEVNGVSDYSEAVSSLGESKHDIAIIRLDTLSEDDLEACSFLHNKFNIPVIILGKEQGDWVWEKAVEAGVDHYVQEPVSGVELAARIRAILRRYKKD